MNPAALISLAVFGALIGAAVFTKEKDEPPPEESKNDWIGKAVLGFGNELMKIFELPRSAEPYQEAIADAENANGLPEGLLGRLLYEESRFREDIISGKTRSRVGALGIAQFMPATALEMGIDPLDPFQAIPAAGRYLRRLYDATGDWRKAVAAYNWGIGNVTRKGLANAPSETRRYVASILSDTGIA